MGVAIAIAVGVALAGFLFVYLEFFAPGGVLGALGGLLIIASAGLVFWQVGAVFWSVLYLALLIALLVVTIRLALWKIRQSAGSNTFYASSSQEGYQAAHFDAEVIGKRGTAVTDLKPAGRIAIDDQWYQAVSEGSYIKKGEAVAVLRGEGARLIVRKEKGK
ncbi:MAG: NfeD family protein [Chlamydiota bacterium]